jgi:hypothetical protein
MYLQGNTIKADLALLDGKMMPYRRLLPMGWPFGVLIHMDGTYYIKHNPGSSYTPWIDEAQVAGSDPVAILAQVGASLARGAVKFRYYTIDDSYNVAARQGAASDGSANMQEGAGPLAAGQDRWAAMSVANNLISQTEQHLLQPPTSAISLGADFVSGAKDGPSSRCLIAVNTANAPRIASIDLTPYWTGKQPIQWSATLSGISLSSPTQQSYTDTFLAGEVRIWVLPK